MKELIAGIPREVTVVMIEHEYGHCARSRRENHRAAITAA